MDRSFQARESMIQLIKHHLRKTQHRMKQLADKHRSERQSAIGVVYRDQMGRYHHAIVREHAEVILCAGAIGSPQLLLLSGIGPRPYLSSWGIQVAHQMLAFRSILTPGQGGTEQMDEIQGQRHGQGLRTVSTWARHSSDEPEPDRES